jgi:transposase
MARAYSNDLRERVASAVLAGCSVREVAIRFEVSVASAVKWSQRLRDTGSAGSRPMGGHKRRVLAGQQAWMLLRLEECPHLTVRALAMELAGRGYRVSPNTVWSMLRKAGHSFKKKPVRDRAGPSQDRPAASAVEEVSGADRSPAAGLYRRDLGQDQHDPDPGLVKARQQAHRQSSVRKMEDADLPCRPAL